MTNFGRTGFEARPGGEAERRALIDLQRQVKDLQRRIEELEAEVASYHP